MPYKDPEKRKEFERLRSRRRRDYIWDWRRSNKQRVNQSTRRTYYRYHQKRKEQLAEYREANRAKMREMISAWAKTHRREAAIGTMRYRARKAAAEGVFTATEWRELLILYGNMCLRCCRTDRKLTADHVVPLSRGGKHCACNIQPLCGPCNSFKNTRTMDFRPFTLEPHHCKSH